MINIYFFLEYMPEIIIKIKLNFQEKIKNINLKCVKNLKKSEDNIAKTNNARKMIHQTPKKIKHK